MFEICSSCYKITMEYNKLVLETQHLRSEGRLDICHPVNDKVNHKGTRFQDMWGIEGAQGFFSALTGGNIVHLCLKLT